MVRPNTRSSHSSPVGILLTVAVLALLVLNWQAMSLLIDVSPDAAGQSPATAPALAVAMAVPDNSAAVEPNYPETTARPLFNPTRRPIQPAQPKAVEEQVAGTTQPLQAQLIGVVSTGPRGQRALVRAGSDKHGSWIAVGEQVGGWRLSAIGPEIAVFESGNRKQVLRITYASLSTTRGAP